LISGTYEDPHGIISDNYKKTFKIKDFQRITLIF